MKNIISEKSYVFALSIVQLCKPIISIEREYILTKQLIRSGTAIGAVVREAEHAQSKADFLNKMNISLKEANETLYWLMLLKDAGYMTTEKFEEIFPKADELVKILVSIVRTTKQNLK